MTPRAARERVLLVEDDQRVARINRDLLERDPDVHVVGSAATCVQGDALAQALNPDVILLDVHLPDGSGLGLLRHWRSVGRTTDVALITADDEASVRLALAHGAFDDLIKPFTGARLADLLARHRSRRLPATPGPELLRPDQGRLDRLLGMQGRGAESLPRGVDPHTLERVAQALDGAGGGVSAEDVGERLGLSRVTAWGGTWSTSCAAGGPAWSTSTATPVGPRSLTRPARWARICLPDRPRAPGMEAPTLQHSLTPCSPRTAPVAGA